MECILNGTELGLNVFSYLKNAFRQNFVSWKFAVMLLGGVRCLGIGPELADCLKRDGAQDPEIKT